MFPDLCACPRGMGGQAMLRARGPGLPAREAPQGLILTSGHGSYVCCLIPTCWGPHLAWGGGADNGPQCSVPRKRVETVLKASLGWGVSVLGGLNPGAGILGASAWWSGQTSSPVPGTRPLLPSRHSHSTLPPNLGFLGSTGLEVIAM